MIISHKHKFVFVHNPKVAGSAVRKAIQHLHDDATTYWHQKYIPALERVVDAAHLTINDLMICRPDLKGYTFFGFNRDPFHRYASAFYEHRRQHFQPDNFTEINEWTAEIADETNFRFNWKYIHFCPQHYFNPLNYKTFSAPNSLWLDYLNMEESFQILTQSVDGLQGCALPTVRQRPDSYKSLFDEMDNNTVDRIQSIYHADLGYFSLSDYKNHYERINGIHNPSLSIPMFSSLTEGEQYAYNEVTSSAVPK